MARLSCILLNGLLFLPVVVSASPDSLIRAANHIMSRPTPTSADLHYIHSIATTVRHRVPDTVLLWTKWIREKSVAVKAEKLNILCVYMESELYNIKGRYFLSRNSAVEGITLSKKIRNDSLLATGYNGYGVALMHIGKYEEGIQALNTALKLRERLKDQKGIATTLCSIGLLYYESQNNREAKKYIDLALSSRDNAHILLNALHTKANILGMEGNFAEALELDRRGLEVCRKKKAEYAYSMFYDNMANCYMFMGEHEKARQLFQQSLKVDSSLGNIKLMSDTYSNLSAVAVLEKRYHEAVMYGQRALELSRSGNSLRGVSKAYENLAEVYGHAGQYKKAFEYAKKTAKLKDSLVTVRTKDKLDEFNVVYETTRKEAEINSLKQQHRINQLLLNEQELLLQKRQYQLLAFAGITILLGIVGFLLYNRQQLRQRQLREKAVMDAEYKERMRIARDVHDDLGAGLSRITLMAELAQRKVTDDYEIGNTIKSIAVVSKELVENMRDMIWLLNPANTTIENLLVHIREYVSDYLEDAGIQAEIHMPGEIDQTRLSRETQRNIFLTIKEAVHNVVKHAVASRVILEAKFHDSDLTIRLTDNGKGITRSERPGNGLKNMRARIESIGGRFQLTSASSGTTIEIDVRLDNANQNQQITL